MCVIAVKEKGVDFPSWETLENCYKNNSDGAGFMYVHKGKVKIMKGFMSFKSLEIALKKVKKTIDVKNTPMVFHFRISTQGKIDGKNCHPFPITSNIDDITATRITTDVGLAHNGVISLTSSYRRDIPYSDTVLFVRDYASLIIDNPQYYKSEKNVTLLDRLADSKLAILSNDGHIELIGKFEETEDGMKYSNSSYQPRNFGFYSYDMYNDYGWDSMYGDSSSHYLSGYTSYTSTYVSKNKGKKTIYACPCDVLEHSAVIANTYDSYCELIPGVHYYDYSGNLYEYEEDLEVLIKLDGARVLGSDMVIPRVNYTKAHSMAWITEDEYYTKLAEIIDNSN